MVNIQFFFLTVKDFPVCLTDPKLEKLNVYLDFFKCLSTELGLSLVRKKSWISRIFSLKNFLPIFTQNLYVSSAGIRL